MINSIDGAAANGVSAVAESVTSGPPGDVPVTKASLWNVSASMSA